MSSQAQKWRALSAAYRILFEHGPVPRLVRWWALMLPTRNLYREAFKSEARRLVLLDLAAVCHAHDTTHVVGDSHGSAQLEGRRQVWLHIQRMTQTTDEEILRWAKQEAEA